MPKDKTKGLISGPECYGLIDAIIHHTGESKLDLIAQVIRLGEDPIKMLKERGKMLEQDMMTLNNALIKILNIAKRNNYEDIRRVIEDSEYEHGHEWPSNQEMYSNL